MTLILIPLILAALAWLVAASIFDLKTREIPDLLNFSLIAFALAYRAFVSIVYWDYSFFLQGIFGYIVFFVLAYAFYYSRVFAGGDAKLLMALGPVIGFSSGFIGNIGWILAFLLSFIIFGAIYGLVFSISLMFVHLKAFKKEYAALFVKNKIYFILGFALFIASYFILLKLRVEFYYLVPFIFILIPFLFCYAKALENSCMIKEVETNKLRQGDFLYRDVIIRGKKLRFVIKSNFEGLSNEEIKVLRKYKKSVFVKDGIPFGPVFLFAFIAIAILFLWQPDWSLWKFFSWFV